MAQAKARSAGNVGIKVTRHNLIAIRAFATGTLCSRLAFISIKEMLTVELVFVSAMTVPTAVSVHPISTGLMSGHDRFYEPFLFHTEYRLVAARASERLF